MGPRVRRGTFAAALCVALLLPGCVAIDPANPPSWLPRALVPTVTPPAEPKTQEHPKVAKRANVWKAYFVRQGRLAAVERPGKPADVAPEKMLETLLAGPSAEERKAGLTNAIPSGTRVLAVGRDMSGNVYVDLGSRFAAGGSGTSMRPRVAQLVWTFTQVPGVSGVLIKIEGKPVQRFGREGLDLIRPQHLRDYADLGPSS